MSRATCGLTNPMPLEDPVVVNSLGGEDVLYVIVHKTDGTLQAFYPSVEKNTVEVSPFDPDKDWENLKEIQVLIADTGQSLTFEQSPLKKVICECVGGTVVCKRVQKKR